MYSGEPLSVELLGHYVARAPVLIGPAHLELENAVVAGVGQPRTIIVSLDLLSFRKIFVVRFFFRLNRGPSNLYSPSRINNFSGVW